MSQASALEQLMLDLINEERASAGLAPLRFNPDLNEASEDHSEWMLEQDIFSHTGENGSSAGDRIQEAGYELEGNWTWGENIAWQSERGEPGLEDDVRDLHEGLMNSPGHRANILNPDFEEIGIGIERGDFGRFDSVMVTQNFGTTDATPDPVPAPAPEPEPEPTPAPEPEPPVVDYAPEPAPPTSPEVAEPEAPAPVPPAPENPSAPVVPTTFTPSTPQVPETPPQFQDLWQDIFDFAPSPTPAPTIHDLLSDLFGINLPTAPQPQAPQPVAQPDLPDAPDIPAFTMTLEIYQGFDLGA